jgi:hypothetical protein
VQEDPPQFLGPPEQMPVQKDPALAQETCCVHFNASRRQFAAMNQEFGP